MQVGLILKWGKLVPGREQQAIELFAEAKQFMEEQLKAGIITYYEPFIYSTGDWETEAGFWLVKGDRDKVIKLVETEAYRWLMTKAGFMVDHLQFEWLLTGESVAEEIERVTKLATEYAYVH
jgi:hypothetical protein